MKKLKIDNLAYNDSNCLRSITKEERGDNIVLDDVISTSHRHATDRKNGFLYIL